MSHISLTSSYTYSNTLTSCIQNFIHYNGYKIIFFQYNYLPNIFYELCKIHKIQLILQSAYICCEILI